jgi:hypothetical protein
MNEVYSVLASSVLIGWVVFKLADLASESRTAGILALLVGLSVSTFARQTQPMLYFTAILSPVAISIPLLALRSVGRSFGFGLPRFQRWEIGLFLLIYVTFLAASLGAVSFDPYRLGYDPAWATVVALLLVAYGAWRRNPVLPVIGVGGQVLWLAGIGSSNYLDQIGHALLVPILIIALVWPDPR